MSVGGGHVRVLLHGIPLWGCVGVEVRVLCLCLGLHGCKLLGRALGQWSIGNVLVHGDLGAATAAAACGAARHPPAAARHDRQHCTSAVVFNWAEGWGGGEGSKGFM